MFIHTYSRPTLLYITTDKKENKYKIKKKILLYTIVYVI